MFYLKGEGKFPLIYTRRYIVLEKSRVLLIEYRIITQPSKCNQCYQECCSANQTFALMLLSQSKSCEECLD